MDDAAYLQIPNRIEKIRECMSACTLCPRNCKVNRLEGHRGFCGLDEKIYCFREMTNMTEEPGLVPSHQVYFAGCNLRCGFCSVGEWNESPMHVPVIKAEELPQRIEMRKKQGAINLNLLGGEPSVSMLGILELLQNIPADTKLVWNSNMYFNGHVRDSLDGLVDTYLADYKCDNNDCCRKMLGAANYTEVIRSNLTWAIKRAELLIRHVVLPEHYHCCTRPILEWVAKHVPTAQVSLRSDYIPPLPAGECPAVYLHSAEYQKAVELARDLDLNLVGNYNE